MTHLAHLLVPHLFWLWLSAILLIPAALELLWYYVVVLRAYDVDYDQTRCRNASPMIELRKAQRRRVSWPCIGLPLYLIAVALFATQLLFQGWTTYATIGIAWFFSAPLRKVWGIAVARAIARRSGDAPTTSFAWDVSTYYDWGFAFPSRPQDKQWFTGKLRWLNKFQNLWLLLQFYRFWGVGAQALASAVWPLMAVCSVFHHMDMSDDYQRPWWRFDRAERRPTPIASG